MHILELPRELVDTILYYSILARDLRRALRLQLVCKSFRAAFRPMLYRTRLLDRIYYVHDFAHWGHRRHYGADVLWHDYLLFRSRTASNEPDSYFGELWTVSHVFSQHCQAHPSACTLSQEEILDKICWLVLDGAGVVGWPGWDREDRDPPNLGQDLLSVATYFGFTSLVRDLLEEGHDPAIEYQLFPPAIYIAAFTGQADMLRLLQKYLPDYEAKRTRKHRSGHIWYSWRSKIGPWSLYGAARRGDLNMVRLALNPPMCNTQTSIEDVATEPEADGNREIVPDSKSMLQRPPGSVPPSSELGLYLRKAMGHAQSPEIYQYLLSFLDPAQADPEPKHHELARMAAAGNVAMVRHLLDLGADPSHPKTNKGTALLHAVRGSHLDVVDLLLARGADPSAMGWERLRTPLTAAAQTGSLVLLRKLLAAGAEGAAQRKRHLHAAAGGAAGTHGHGGAAAGAGGGDGRGGGIAFKTAEAQGLESMAGVLWERGA
ncbi:ankyrin, partial [Apiospora marii]|uniref:ankyrin n=1 Tax=Apiospora marii TaxID=335849 RepID=UPI0031311102